MTDAPVVRERPGHPKVLARETGGAALDPAAQTRLVRAEAPSQLAVIRAFRTVLKGTFGNSADVLADFGLAPPKAPTPPSAEKKAVAVAKRAATRAARGTVAKNKKKAIKGAVTATLVVTPLDAHSVAPCTLRGSSPTGGSPHANLVRCGGPPDTTRKAGASLARAAPPAFRYLRQEGRPWALAA